jgi:integrase/recombinase XerD
MTKEEILDKLVQDIRLRGLSEDTVAEYHTKARVFMEYFDKPADQMGEAEFREFLQYLQDERKLSPASINTYNSGLRFLYEVTLEQNLNYKRIPRVKEPILLPNIMTVKEIEKFFGVIDDLRYKAIFLTVYGSGLRLREVRHLRVSDVDSEQMRLFIYQSKGKKDRFAVLSQTSLTVLREYWKAYRPNHPEGYLFLNRTDTECISNRAIQDAFKKYRDRAQLTCQATVHTLRHSYATHLLESGVSIFYIRQLLGHATIWTTTRYLHVASTDIMKTKSPLDTMTEKKKRGRPRKVVADD